jgi:phytoene dehydrogenase-like protein
MTDMRYWESLTRDSENYQSEKEKISKAFIDAVDQVWPGITADIEMCDIATPLTFQRITGNYQASITGWSLTPDQAGASIPKSLPGLENFWMVGQWVYPGGGLPAGVITGREVIWLQCRKDKKTFTVPNS